MKKVKQEHSTGCGIACVASILGEDYFSVFKKAKEIFDWGEKQRTFYTKSEHLIRILEEYGVAASKERSVGRWEAISDLAIVAINFNEKKNRWHWVVFLRNGEVEYVIDPRSKREVRTDFGRMKLRSYIPLSSNSFNARDCSVQTKGHII